MFKLFEKQITAAMQSIAARKKSTNELIDEIHESFYTEVDRLLAEAKITNSLHSDKQDLIDKRACPLEIAAPAKDFNLSEAEIKNFKITKVHIPDPVVLQPVFFKGEKYYLIVTAWGQEASDELVVNHKMN